MASWTSLTGFSTGLTSTLLWIHDTLVVLIGWLGLGLGMPFLLLSRFYRCVNLKRIYELVQMTEYFFCALTEIDSLGKCHIWHSSKLFLPRQWGSEESSYRGNLIFLIFLANIFYAIRCKSCLSLSFHDVKHASIILPSKSIWNQKAKQILHTTLNLWYFCFWQVYIRRSYQAYELTTLYHEKVPVFSFLHFPPHIVMLAINFHQVQWLSSNEYLYWTSEGRS